MSHCFCCLEKNQWRPSEKIPGKEKRTQNKYDFVSRVFVIFAFFLVPFFAITSKNRDTKITQFPRKASFVLLWIPPKTCSHPSKFAKFMESSVLEGARIFSLFCLPNSWCSVLFPCILSYLLQNPQEKVGFFIPFLQSLLAFFALAWRNLWLAAQTILALVVVFSTENPFTFSLNAETLNGRARVCALTDWDSKCYCFDFLLCSVLLLFLLSVRSWFEQFYLNFFVWFLSISHCKFVLCQEKQKKRFNAAAWFFIAFVLLCFGFFPMDSLWASVFVWNLKLVSTRPSGAHQNRPSRPDGSACKFIWKSVILLLPLFSFSRFCYDFELWITSYLCTSPENGRMSKNKVRNELLLGS